MLFKPSARPSLVASLRDQGLRSDSPRVIAGPDFAVVRKSGEALVCSVRKEQPLSVFINHDHRIRGHDTD